MITRKELKDMIESNSDKDDPEIWEKIDKSIDEIFDFLDMKFYHTEE